MRHVISLFETERLDLVTQSCGPTLLRKIRRFYDCHTRLYIIVTRGPYQVNLSSGSRGERFYQRLAVRHICRSRNTSKMDIEAQVLGARRVL